MEADWNKLTEAERASFAAWHKAQQAPKRYADMNREERADWHRKNGVPAPAGGIR